MSDIENLIENVDYEWVELPSKGECYPHKKSKVPVAYIKAIDENIIASPKHIASHTICDELLKRKILDKDFTVENLCVGDRNAILVWLRLTGYGDVAENPQTKKSVNLSTLKFKDFKLTGDENGYFNYLLDNGDVVKYRLLTHNDELNIINQSKDIAEEYFNDIGLSIILECVVSFNDISDSICCKQSILNLDNQQKELLLKYIVQNNPDIDFSDIDIAIDDSLFINVNNFDER